MKKLVLLVFALNICLGTFAQFTPEDTLKYRISLKDKAATDYSLQKPEMYLSKKSIERRKRQGLEIDSTDLQVEDGALVIDPGDAMFLCHGIR